MNALIKYLYEKGLSKEIYLFFHVLGFIAVFLLVVWYAKRLNIPRWKAVATVCIVYPIIYAWMYVLCWMESGFRVFGGNNIVRVFVYVPLVGLLVTKWLKIDRPKMLGLLALAPLMVHGVSHLGCIFLGCCHGFPCEWGIYNAATGYATFPIQPIEAIGALAIIGVLLCRAKKAQYTLDGLEYPLMLIMYGASRFIFEFLRDNEKLVFGISSLAFHALFMVVVGVVWICVDTKRHRKTNVAPTTA